MTERAITIDIANLEATLAVGRRLGVALASGHVIGLIGPLGSGKTMLVKGLAAGAGVVDPRQVNSPTFVIVNEYEAGGRGGPPLRIYHVDTYRLGGSDELEALGFDEMCASGAVVIEWADRVADLLPADVLTVAIEPIDADRRRFHCWASGPAAQRLLTALPTALRRLGRKPLPPL